LIEQEIAPIRERYAARLGQSSELRV